MASDVKVDRNELRKLVADVLDIDPTAITDEAHFVEDLGGDSLLALELAVTLERRYEIKIESNEIADVVRVSDIINLLDRKRSSVA